MLLNWCPLGVKMNLRHAHKTRFWYLLGVFLKFSDEHPCHFYRGVPPWLYFTSENKLSHSYISTVKVHEYFYYFIPFEEII